MSKTDTRTDAQVEADRDDREFLLRPHAWPGQCPARLYVKRRQPDPTIGPETGPLVLWGTDPDEYVISAHHWHGDLLPTPHAAEVAAVDDTITNLRYTSVDDVLADGWVVD